MDTHQRPSSVTPDILPPAQLWIGTERDIIHIIHTYMQQRWCPARGCNQCITCKNIIEHQYHKASWICSDGHYTRENLEPIFDTLKLMQDPTSEMIIVIQKADCLTPACYNSLLKSIEEPPRGYHFLLTARRLKEVADTIKSRCIISHKTTTQGTIENPLIQVFTQQLYAAPHDFMHILETEDPDEHQSRELIDTLLLYWIAEYKKARISNTQDIVEHIEHNIALFKQAAEEPPLPGSSTLFWKNLFVQFKK